MCKDCYRVLPLGAANQRLRPASHARAGLTRPIYAGAVPVPPACEAEDRQDIILVQPQLIGRLFLSA